MATEQIHTEEQGISNDIKSQGKNGEPTTPGKKTVRQKESKQNKSKKAATEKVADKPAKKKASSKTAEKKSTGKKIKKEAIVVSTEAEENTSVAKQKKTKKAVAEKVTKLLFQLKFHTNPGESISITGNHEMFGNNNPEEALEMQYLNEHTWVVSFDMPASSVPAEGIEYNYVLKNAENVSVFDWGMDKVLTPDLFKYDEVLIADAWNHAGYYDNAFYTEPFQNVLLKNNFTEVKTKQPKSFTHIFRIKAPLLKKGETVCILGSAAETGLWNEATPVLLSRKPNEDYHSVALDLSKVDLPLTYKYGIYDTVNKKFIRYEDGGNRVLFQAHAAAKNKITIANDGFIRLPDYSWKGAGVSIPVFSLKSKHSWGVGEFTDIKLLVDWAKKTRLQLIQILPVNDTNATGTWADSYPYASISAFALHPMYLNPDALVKAKNKKLLSELKAEREELNKKDAVDYEAVTKLKWRLIKQVYPLQKEETFASSDYKSFYNNNKHWLVPYAAFCYYRDVNNTSDFNNWSSNKTYNAAEAEALFDNTSTADAVLIHCFVQFHLHLQLQEAAAYAHENGVIIKGDIAIGIYRYGADAWQHPELFHMEMQAGAPPDDFAVKGQNWGFPTYNWQKMEAGGFAWWRQRFEQMSYYFDAFRIDHILGFFRIWSIPVDSVEGIMGHFEPCIPVHINEFYQKNIWFDFNRYTKPFITDQLLNDVVSSEAESFQTNLFAK